MPRYEDGQHGLKIDKDYLGGATKEGATLGSKENLFAPGQLTPSEAYREGWERIWGKYGKTLGVSQQDYAKETSGTKDI